MKNLIEEVGWECISLRFMWLVLRSERMGVS